MYFPCYFCAHWTKEDQEQDDDVRHGTVVGEKVQPKS